MKTEIGVIGAGNMGSAMIRGMAARGIRGEYLGTYTKTGKNAKLLASELQTQVFESIENLAQSCDTIILAFKPQHLHEMPESLKIHSENKLIISILAGKSLSTLSKYFPNARNIIRAMPNMPCQIGEGITGYCSQKKLSLKDLERVNLIFTSLGDSIALEENQIDAVTAISGCGPAYIFEFIKAQINAAKQLGFNEELATRLVTKTVSGASKLLEVTGKSPQELIDQVSSKKGTTVAALSIFQEKGLHSIVTEAIFAAKKRSEELSKI